MLQAQYQSQNTTASNLYGRLVEYEYTKKKETIKNMKRWANWKERKKKCPGLLKDTRHNKCIYYSEPHIITRPFLLGTAFVWSKIIFHILFTFCHVVVMYGDVDGTIPSTKLTVDFCILSKWWCACFFIAMLIFSWFFFNSNQ